MDDGSNKNSGERTTDSGPTHGAHGGESDARDRAIVRYQIGREPRAMQSVGARCVYGLPAVTRQSAVDADGRPFPTAFYLTCPHLVRQIDRLEAAGGVRRFEDELTRDDELRAATDRSHDRHAALTTDRGADIAATGDRAHLKCLHAHAAFALAEGDHPLGARVLAEAAPRWCDDAKCLAALRTPAAAPTG